ncbi:hypothetical protein KCU95_g10684, partial [Aureobasidium melanogenum]
LRTSLIETVKNKHHRDNIVPAPSQFLWCDEHAEIAAWLARKNLGMEFYGSFVNYCARSMDKLRRTNNRLLKDHLFDLRKTLTTQPLSGAAVLHEMKYYHNRFFRTGTVKTGVCPLETLLAKLEFIHAAHSHLYNKVFPRRALASSSTPTHPPANHGDTPAVVNSTSASLAASATLAAPGSVQQPGLQGQLPLPDGPLLKPLPIREQPLAVASLEASLPALSAPAPAPAFPEQQALEHGTLLLLGGQKEEVPDEVQVEEDGGVNSVYQSNVVLTPGPFLVLNDSKKAADNLAKLQAEVEEGEEPPEVESTINGTFETTFSTVSTVLMAANVGSSTRNEVTTALINCHNGVGKLLANDVEEQEDVPPKVKVKASPKLKTHHVVVETPKKQTTKRTKPGSTGDKMVLEFPTSASVSASRKRKLGLEETPSARSTRSKKTITKAELVDDEEDDDEEYLDLVGEEDENS